METAIKPKFGRVLIKREVAEKIGSIILPDSQKKRHAACEGVIVALGETAGFTEVPGQGQVQTLKVGDKVIFGRHAGAWLDETKEDDGTLFICQDEDILAVKELNA